MAPKIEKYLVSDFTDTVREEFHSKVLNKTMTRLVTTMTCPKCNELVDPKHLPQHKKAGGHSCGLYWWAVGNALLISDEPFLESKEPEWLSRTDAP